jgi:hypothetical protein
MRNDAERRDAVVAIMKKRAIEGTKSTETARKMLIDEGIYSPTGELTVEFGGRAPAQHVMVRGGNPLPDTMGSRGIRTKRRSLLDRVLAITKLGHSESK